MSWQQAVELAKRAGEAAAETVKSMLAQNSISTRSKNCLALAVAQELIKSSIAHYDTRNAIAVETMYDENTGKLVSEISSLARDAVVNTVGDNAETANMAVLFAVEALIQSVQLIDPIGGEIAQKVEELITESIKSELVQRCLVLATAIQMLSIWIGSCGERVGILVQPGHDVTSSTTMRIAAMTLGTISMRSSKQEVNYAALSAAAILVMSVSPAYATD